MTARHRITFALPAALAGLALAPDAPGAVIYSYYNNTVDHAYKIVHMPDFDQRRAESADGSIPGLPNDGAMYCAPTSSMNVCAYIATHGYPTVPPQDYPWEDPSSYDVATGSDFILGLLMLTSPTTGTGGDGWYDGTSTWVPLDKFTVSAFYASDTWYPRRWDIAQSAANGSLVALGWGWYSTVGEIGGIPVIQRTGGHCVTLTEIHGGSTDATIFVRDPADDATNLTTQSPFMSRMFWTETRHAYVGGQLRSLDNLTTMQGVISTRFLDGYIAVRPKAGYSFSEPEGAIQLQYVAEMLGALTAPDVAIPVAAQATDFTIDLAQNAIYALVDDGAGLRLVCYSILPGDPIEFDPPLPPDSRITLGRRNILYVAAGELLFLIHAGTGELFSEFGIGNPASALAYDDANDRLLLLDAVDRRIRTYSWDGGVGPAITLPAAMALNGEVSMQWDPTRGGAWVLSRDFVKLYFVPFAPPGVVQEVVLPGLAGPTSVDVDDLGHLFIADAGIVREYARSETGAYVPHEGSLFEGMETGPVFRVTKSRTNFDPAQHVEGWHNVLPEDDYGIPALDCDGDLDGDGAVGFADLLVLLAAWGPCPADDDCLADLDRDGSVDFADLLSMLATWGACP
jgi:hypothetical protein